MKCILGVYFPHKLNWHPPREKLLKVETYCDELINYYFVSIQNTTAPMKKTESECFTVIERSSKRQKIKRVKISKRINRISHKCLRTGMPTWFCPYP